MPSAPISTYSKKPINRYSNSNEMQSSPGKTLIEGNRWLRKKLIPGWVVAGIGLRCHVTPGFKFSFTWETLGKWLILSKPQYPYFWNGIIFLRGENKWNASCLTCCLAPYGYDHHHCIGVKYPSCSICLMDSTGHRVLRHQKVAFIPL